MTIERPCWATGPVQQSTAREVTKRVTRHGGKVVPELQFHRVQERWWWKARGQEWRTCFMVRKTTCVPHWSDDDIFLHQVRKFCFTVLYNHMFGNIVCRPLSWLRTAHIQKWLVQQSTGKKVTKNLPHVVVNVVPEVRCAACAKKRWWKDRRADFIKTTAVVFFF